VVRNDIEKISVGCITEEPCKEFLQNEITNPSANPNERNMFDNTDVIESRTEGDTFQLPISLLLLSIPIMIAAKVPKQNYQ
jgi:hypothetical protein